MSRIHVFGDESGNFDFSRNKDASKYFILTTATFFDDRQACADLQDLRYDLAWSGQDHPGPFHATEDKQLVRDRVYAQLTPHSFRVDVTILEKSKSQPQLRKDDTTFYKYAWWLHMKYVTPRIATSGDELLVIGASIGTKAKRDAFHGAVSDVMSQVTPTIQMKTAAWRDDSDTGLQLADYCCWAMKRKWENADTRSYRLIAPKVQSEFDVFQRGLTHYY